MKNLILFLLCVCLLAVPVFAEGSDPLGLPSPETPEFEEVVENGPADVTHSDFVPGWVGSYGDPAPDPLEVEETPEDILLDSDVVDPLLVDGDARIVTTSSNPIGPEDTSGLKAALLKVLGPYDAIIVEYQRGSTASYQVFQDDVWLCSFWLLAIVIFCLFRLLGGWLVRKQ